MTPKKTKTQIGQFSDTPIESLRDAGREIINDLGTESVNAMWDQILGNYSQENMSTTGELAEGQEIDLSSKKSEAGKQKETPYIEAAIDYRREIIHGEQKITRENEQKLGNQIQEILNELQRLINTSQEIEAQFKDVGVGIMPVPSGKPGKYHANFFSWVLTVVRSARIRVEDSASWLALFKSKKGQKQYWAMFKKHGTTFGMSNERMVATQTG